MLTTIITNSNPAVRRAGGHRLEQVGQLADGSVQKIHPWNLVGFVLLVPRVLASSGWGRRPAGRGVKATPRSWPDQI